MSIGDNTKMKTFIKIQDNLSDKELSKLNLLLDSENIYGIEISYLGEAYGPVWDKDKNYNLDFVNKLTNIKGLSLFLPKTKELDFLPPTLNWLSIGEFDNKKVSLKPISNLSRLKYLSLVRNSNNLSEISKLKQLEQASFTGYQLKKLEFIGELNELNDLYIAFGGGENIDFLKNLKILKRLEILRVRNLSDISSISNLSELEWLKIEDQAQVDQLPDLSNLKKLEHLSLINLKNLKDISALENSHIKELVLLNSNLTREQLKPLIKSKIEKICISLKMKKDTHQINEILGNRVVEYIDTKSQKQEGIKYYRNIA
ncbi:MAG: hypothetical protein ACR2MS_10155 [Weeksellaceae bacterium]